MKTDIYPDDEDYEEIIKDDYEDDSEWEEEDEDKEDGYGITSDDEL